MRVLAVIALVLLVLLLALPLGMAVGGAAPCAGLPGPCLLTIGTCFAILGAFLLLGFTFWVGVRPRSLGALSALLGASLDPPPRFA